MGNLVWKKQIKIKGDVGDVICNTVDKNGNLYISGTFKGLADFNPGFGIDTFNTMSYNGAMFVAKYSTDGDYLWSNCVLSLAPASNVYWFSKHITHQIVIDDSGAAYVYGIFSDSVNFNPGTTAHVLSVVPNTTGNYFLWKVDSTGNFGWVNDFGGNYAYNSSGTTALSGFGGGLAIRPPEESGKQTLVVTGVFSRTSDFDPGPGTAYLAPDSGTQFMAKYQTNNELVWVGNFGQPSNFGGGSNSYRIRMTVNSNGEIYITGNYILSPNINAGSGAPYYLPYCFSMTSVQGGGSNSSSGNRFISKLSSLGNVIWLRW